LSVKKESKGMSELAKVLSNAAKARNAPGDRRVRNQCVERIMIQPFFAQDLRTKNMHPKRVVDDICAIALGQVVAKVKAQVDANEIPDKQSVDIMNVILGAQEAKKLIDALERPVLTRSQPPEEKKKPIYITMPVHQVRHTEEKKSYEQKTEPSIKSSSDSLSGLISPPVPIDHLLLSPSNSLPEEKPKTSMSELTPSLIGTEWHDMDDFDDL
jgi:hypothetical protein